MELKKYIAESLNETRARTLRVVKDLTPEELAWRPGHEANPIGFLLWHIARAEDGIYNRWIASREQVWTTHGWDKRFALKPEDSGNGWTAQQVADFVSPPLDDLLRYMAEVQESVLEHLPQLDLGRLGEKPNPDRPDWTISNMLQLLVIHEAHHQGAIEYLVGLQRSGTY